MVQRPSNYQCRCDSCSNSKYRTRSVTKSCTNHIPVQDQHPEVQTPSHTATGRKQHLVSRLMQSIIRYWTLIMFDKKVLLSQSQPEDMPSSPATTLSNDNTSDGGSIASLSKGDRSSDIEEASAGGSVKEGGSTTKGDLDLYDDANVTRFTLTSLLLGEELKRLQVWRTSFSNSELDRLPTIEHEVAQGVLKCLTSVASILIEGSREWRTRLEPDGLEAEGLVLEDILKEIEIKTTESRVENEAMTDGSGFSESDGSCQTVENQSLIKDLKYEIDRLQLLSHSLRLGISTGVIFENTS